MVNESLNIKDQIIRQLAEADGEPVSGVQLSELLGISRVAVWKHITALKKRGANIASSPKGYCLSDTADSLFPSLFKDEYRNRIFYFKTVKSTMDKARTLARDGAVNLSVVVAETQTHGRGRLNREWTSQDGGLWFTIILKPETPPPLSFVYNFIASSCLSDVLNQIFDLPVKVKWPNDLLLNNRKLAGLLSEMETRGDMVEFINIGIGLNVNNHPDNDEFNAISLADELDKTVSRKLILETFLDDFSNRVTHIDPVQIIQCLRCKDLLKFS